MPQRRLSLLQAVSLNMATMIGMGPFITIPLFVGKVGGPHALLGWLLGALVALADGLVWCELATAFPGSGGTFHFYDAIYGRGRLGRMLKFLFVWQFLISAPMELATGGIGLGHYATFLFPGLSGPLWSLSIGGKAWQITRGQALAIAFVAGGVTLAYRRIEVTGRMMVVLWVGVLITMFTMIGVGIVHFDAALAFDVPEGAFTVNRRFAIGLGGALAIAMYDFLGYYQICYLGDEVREPARNLPRAILISVVAVASLYLAMNLGILGVLPWRDVVASNHVASDFMVRTLGGRAAVVITVLVIWTGAASLFAGILGYSRVPYAAALSGDFFKALGATHPKGDFPHRSLLLMGGLTATACLFDLDTVIAALLASRIWVQFVGQIATVFHLRSDPALRAKLSFRMALFPLPAVVALAGWVWVFATTDTLPMALALATVALGCLIFLARERRPQSG